MRDGQVVEWNDYYAYGAVRDGAVWSDEGRWKYNGHELDKETSTLNYGWRQYDPLIGMFSSVDRLSGKYPALSPFHYGANNPMTTVDVNGDSLFVVINGQNYYWGQYTIEGTSQQWYGFVNVSSGAVYSGGDPFAKSVTEALLTMSTTAAGAELVSNVASSTTLSFTVSRGANATNVAGKYVRDITWDPANTQGGIDEKGATERPAWVGLGHELAHAWSWTLDADINSGHTRNTGIWFPGITDLLRS